MLDSLFRLELSVDLGRCGSCIMVIMVSTRTTVGQENRDKLTIPAAAAGSPGDALLASILGLRGSPLRGLRVRAAPDCRDDGDRERRSNRDARLGSGSFWSNRERLGRCSSSAMTYIQRDSREF